jgi:hypothetical protein
VTIGDRVTRIEHEAFAACNLTSVTIPKSVASIEAGAFLNCARLAEVYFKGNAPSLGASPFSGDTNATVYYLPGTTGWGATFGGRPAKLLPMDSRAERENPGVRSSLQPASRQPAA